MAPGLSGGWCPELDSACSEVGLPSGELVHWLDPYARASQPGVASKFASFIPWRMNLGAPQHCEDRAIVATSRLRSFIQAVAVGVNNRQIVALFLQRYRSTTRLITRVG